MESPHWTGSDDRDSLSARPCDRCAEQDAITTWDHLYVCGDCFRALENYDGEPVEFDRELAKTYPRTA